MNQETHKWTIELTPPRGTKGAEAEWFAYERRNLRILSLGRGRTPIEALYKLVKELALEVVK